MAINFLSSGAGAGTETSGAALNLVCPGVVSANDILIAHVMHTASASAPSTPAGWSLLFGPVGVGLNTVLGRHWCFGKLADGTEDGATISFGTAGGTNGRAGRIYSFSGYVSGALADVVPAASFSSISHDTDPQGPSVTTTVAGALAVALTCQDDNNTEEAIAGSTGGTWGGFLTFVSATLGPQGLHIDIQVATPTGDPGTISGGAMVAANDESGTIGFEIRPNAAGGGGDQTITSAGNIGSGEAFGADLFSFTLLPSTIDTNEAFGTAQFDFTVLASGIATEEVFGAAAITLYIAAGDIVSEEVFGATMLLQPAADQTIGDAGGIGSAEAFGGGTEIIPEAAPQPEQPLEYHGSGRKKVAADQEDEYELARKREELLALRRQQPQAPTTYRGSGKQMPTVEAPAEEPEPPAAISPDTAGVVDEAIRRHREEQARASAAAAAQLAEVLAEAQRRADDELLLIAAVALAVDDDD